MAKLSQRRLLVGFAIAILMTGFTYVMVEHFKFENQLDTLKQFCGRLQLQASVEEVRVAVAVAPGLQMVLLEPNFESAQSGSVYFHGSGRGACSVTFVRGRLIQKAFSFGLQDPSRPGEKLKPY